MQKKIPCRVCGKLFEPCAYCQKHNDTFRWRNFACSRECAIKYINSAKSYRTSQKEKAEVFNDFETIQPMQTSKKKTYKKAILNESEVSMKEATY